MESEFWGYVGNWQIRGPPYVAALKSMIVLLA